VNKDLVQVHFDKTAKEFDSIYTGEKSKFGRFLDRKLRWDMEKRFERTIQECGDIKGKSIIDIGCGSGRFMEILQTGYPDLILGVDFAPNMLLIAQNILHAKMTDSPSKFVVGDFNKMAFKSGFDITLAIGLFDYIEDPLDMLNKMRTVTKEKLIATFPRSGTLRSVIRKVRLGVRGCPVYYFSEDQVKKLLLDSGFTIMKFEVFGQLIFITAK